MNIPIIGLNYLIEDFTTSGLLGNDRGSSTLHGFQRGDTERLGNGRHNEYITILINFVHLFTFHKAGKMETVCNATFGSHINHGIQHITRCNTSAAASTKYSGPFCIVIRPRKVTTFSFECSGRGISWYSCESGYTALCMANTFLGS